MAYKLEISPHAEAQLDNILGYIAVTLCNPDAAGAVAKDLQETYKLLEESAESFAYCADLYLSSKGYRKVKLRRHDYLILYRVVGAVVQISGIFHELEDYAAKL